MAQVSYLRNGVQNIVEDQVEINLEVMTLVSMAKEICKDRKIRLLIKKKASREKRRDRLFCDLKMWNEIRTQMEKSGVRNCAIPPLVQKKVLFILRPIISELIKWFATHKDLFRMDDIFFVRDGFDMTQCVMWTVHGTINEFETALSIVNNSHVHVVDRFFIACTYCTDNLLPNLVNQMGIAERSAVFVYSLQMNPVIRQSIHCDCSFLPMFAWAYYNNTHALNCIFEALNPTERNQCLRIIKDAYLFSPKLINFIAFKQNTDDFSTFMIRKCTSLVLIYLLDWPNQTRFYESYRQLMNFMKKEDFHELFCSIIYNKINQKCDDYDYREVIVFLWNNCPEDIKIYMGKQWVYPKLMYTIENDIVVNRELFVKEKIHNLILMIGYWIKYIIKNYDMHLSSFFVILISIVLYWSDFMI